MQHMTNPEPSNTPHAQLELKNFLPYRLSVLSNRISSSIAREYSQRFGLGVTEWRVIAVLGRYPDLSAGEVAARTAMDKVAVSRAVARLLERGRQLLREFAKLSLQRIGEQPNADGDHRDDAEQHRGERPIFFERRVTADEIACRTQHHGEQ